jgi:Mrr N-terminal domain/SeqA protein N-terminal domain
METVEIDDDVWAMIRENAEPFSDTPNDVLRRLLGIDAGPAVKSVPRTQAKRASPGSILPESAYEPHILRALRDSGGEAPAVGVLDVLARAMAKEITEQDREVLTDGEERWRSRAQFARLGMRKRGLIDGDAPRGIWRLTPEGESAARDL